jgi:hypothetical protein
MRKVQPNFVISDLRGIGPRRSDSGAVHGSPSAPALAAFIKTALVESRSRLARYIQRGEAGWSLRNGAVMEEAGKAIRELPMGEDAEWIGEYYLAQSLNRQGLEAYAQANKMLEGVIDHGPRNYSLKALVALVANVCAKDGGEAARPIYAEAVRMSASCDGSLQATFSLAFQSAFMRHLEGDDRGALAHFQDLEPMARRIARAYPAVWDHYCNNVAVMLVANDRLDEAEYYVEVIRESPFAGAYLEWQRTCQEFDARCAIARSGVVAIFLIGSATPMADVDARDLESESSAIGAAQQSELDIESDAEPVPIEPAFEQFAVEAARDCAASNPHRNLDHYRSRVARRPRFAFADLPRALASPLFSLAFQSRSPKRLRSSVAMRRCWWRGGSPPIRPPNNP